MSDHSLFAAASRERCLRFRRRILDISQTVTALHIAPAFSCLEMVDCIYYGLMRRPPSGPSPDAFILSKGHGCMAQYVILEELKVLSPDDLALYCKPGGQLGAHPDYGVPGIEASTGSLGHGLSIGLGMAYADRVHGTDRRTFVLISDGEVQEGSTWEACLMAPTLGLTNLIVLIDNNDFQTLGRTSETHPSVYPLTPKFDAFGWEAREVNGHDAHEILQAVSERRGDRPFMLVCKTTKGRGVSYMENVPIWHYRSPSAEEYALALSELTEVSS
jgi:transketolase